MFLKIRPGTMVYMAYIFLTCLTLHGRSSVHNPLQRLGHQVCTCLQIKKCEELASWWDRTAWFLEQFEEYSMNNLFFVIFSAIMKLFLYLSTTTAKPYPTKWGRLHGSNYAIVFYHKPNLDPTHWLLSPF